MFTVEKDFPKKSVPHQTQTKIKIKKYGNPLFFWNVLLMCTEKVDKVNSAFSLHSSYSNTG